MYKKTLLEERIRKHYASSGVTVPPDINIERFAKACKIKVLCKPMPARYDIFKGYKGIVLDSRCNKKEKKEQFFRTLYYIIYNKGHQTALLESERQLLQEKARRFKMYLTLPYFLLKEYNIYDPCITKILSEDFCVTEELCMFRIKNIINKTIK